MQDLLLELRALGVHIPDGLNNDALLRLAKLLNPWTVSTGPVGQGMYFACTREGNTVMAEGAAQAAMLLLREQLSAGRYTVQDTTYKQDSMRFRANQ